MGLFDFKKKKAPVTTQQPQATKIETNSFGEHYDRLTPDGELPFGWISRNKDFVNQIEGEYSYFLNMWIEARKKSPEELYPALKSFVLYLEDVEKLCKSKGECFDFWFHEIIAPKDYIQKRKGELEELIANFDQLESNYNKRNDLNSNLDDYIIKMLIASPGVLQSEFIKIFDPLVQNDVREKLYFMEKSGNLERIKSGRSYILNYKQ